MFSQSTTEFHLIATRSLEGAIKKCNLTEINRKANKVLQQEKTAQVSYNLTLAIFGLAG